MALSNTMVTHADWANLLTHGSATQNASPPFVPTVRVQYGGKSVNDMSRVQDPPHSPSKPLSAGGKQRQSSPHDSGPRDSTNHRKSSASHVDDVTQPQESRRGRSQASASGSRDIRFSPSTPKRSATQTQAHGNDRGAAGGDREKTSRSRSIHAEHHSPLLDSHATSAKSSGAEQMEQRARLQLQEKLRTRAAKREPHAQAASPTKAPSTSGLRRSSSRESTAHRATKPRKPKVYCGNNKLDPQLKINGGHLEIGDRGKCFQQGFGSALFQHVSDEAAFLAKYSGKYEHLVPQRLWYKNSPAPTHEGYQPATLSQCRLRGWGAGSAELARRLRAKRHSPSA